LTKAVVLVSGGMDSAVTLAYALEAYDHVYAVNVDYGQINRKELEAAEKLCEHFKVPLTKFKLTPTFRSALTGLPAVESKLPATWVPNRNAILLSIAVAYAVSVGAQDVHFGANIVDYSGYPDCRPEFVRAFNKMIAKSLGDEFSVTVSAPLTFLSKMEIVELGERLKVPWALTWSCYSDQSVPCGKCNACKLRHLGFTQAGVCDPLLE